MSENLNCPRCAVPLSVWDEDLPYEEDEVFEVKCDVCDIELEVFVVIQMDHYVRCTEDGHRWSRSFFDKDKKEKLYNGKKYAVCIDCDEGEFVDPKLVKTKEEWKNKL